MAEQHFQIAAKALIRDDEGKILMVRIPAWGGNPSHWDLPGGRMDPGETFLETLKRELDEELCTTYVGVPRHAATLLTNITIPVGEARVPLVFLVFHTEIPSANTVALNPDSHEEGLAWFSPSEAAEHLAYKLTPEFCTYVRTLA